jgi:hypothetical protein
MCCREVTMEVLDVEDVKWTVQRDFFHRFFFLLESTPHRSQSWCLAGFRIQIHIRGCINDFQQIPRAFPCGECDPCIVNNSDLSLFCTIIAQSCNSTLLLKVHSVKTLV